MSVCNLELANHPAARLRRTYLFPFLIIVPQHCTALAAKATFPSGQLCRFVILIKLHRSDILPVHKRIRVRCMVHLSLLDLVLSSKDLERISIAHDIHASHIPAGLAADGALA